MGRKRSSDETPAVEAEKSDETPVPTGTEDAEALRPEAFEGLPIQVESLNVVNEGTATDEQRARLQGAHGRLSSMSWAAANEVRVIRELLFGDAEMVK